MSTKNANAKKAATVTIISNAPTAAPKKTDPAKKGKEKEALKEKNLTAAADTAKEKKAERELKYKYETKDGVALTHKEKKDFRRNARTTRARMELNIKKLKKSTEPADKKELEQLEKEFAKFKTATYSNPEA